MITSSITKKMTNPRVLRRRPTGELNCGFENLVWHRRTGWPQRLTGGEWQITRTGSPLFGKPQDWAGITTGCDHG